MGNWTSFSCGLVLIGVESTVAQASASGFKLQRPHPQFGKCTSGDLSGRPIASEFSFLQDEHESFPDDECLQLLEEQGIPTAEVLNSTEQANGESEWFLAEDASLEDILNRAKELYGAFTASSRRELVQAIWSPLKHAARDSTVFVLGTGPEIFLLSKMSKTVVVLETDAKACEEFLRSKAGVCAMQSNVHIYCYRSQGGSSLAPVMDKVDPSAARQVVEAKASFHDSRDQLSTSVGQAFSATQNLLEDLVRQQFGELPMSALVVLGLYPVAKLMMADCLIDQSTVILTRGRMSYAGLLALRDVMRVINYSGNLCRVTSHSTCSVFLLQRLYGIERRESPWLSYTAPHWSLQDDLKPRQLVESLFKEIESAGYAENADERKRKALGVYMRVFDQMAVRGTDEDWNRINTLASSFKTAEGEKFDSVLARVGESAAKLLKEIASRSGLQEYFKLVLEVAKDSDPLLHPVICELFANALTRVASANLLGQAEDSIEDACELGESTPKMLLPLLRLIQGGLMGDDYMGKVAQVIVGLRKMGQKVDASVVTTLTASAEA